MQNQKTRTRILGVESESRLETAAVIGTLVLFAIVAVIAWIAIDMQASR
ncbi:MAG: hypothetical protein JWO99_442 [Candidatus Saccharibacteria bacterium]|nr:hypothetical protein [Candidatus Saccharibacteria bacterium]